MHLLRIVSPFLILAALAGPLFVSGQSPSKKMLQPSDYDLWAQSSTIKETEVSPDGRWIYYAIKTSSGDSVFIRGVGTAHRYQLLLPSAPVDFRHHLVYGRWNFSANSAWFAAQGGDSVCVIELSSGKSSSFRSTGFSFLGQSNRILLNNTERSISVAIIHDLHSGRRWTFDQVTEFALNPGASLLAVAAQQGAAGQLSVVSLTGSIIARQVATVPGEKTFSLLSWSTKGDVLACIERSKGEEASTATDSVHLFDFRANQARPVLSRFMPSSVIPIVNQRGGTIRSIVLAEDGRRLFLEVQERKYSNEDTAGDSLQNAVQIWGTTALSLPPVNKHYNRSYWYTWQPSGHFESLTDSTLPFAFLTGDQQRIIQYTDQKYLPEHLYGNRFIDLCLKDPTTGNSRILVEKVKNQYGEVLASPNGRYIAYFKQKNWWVYCFATGVHRCVTESIKGDWENLGKRSTGTPLPFGSPGWLDDDRSLMLYDRYDIWVVNPDGSNARRITNGRTEEITFRLPATQPAAGVGNVPTQFASEAYNGNRGFLVTSSHYKSASNGLWWWSERKGLEKWMVKDKQLTQMTKAEPKHPLVFTEMDFDMSPRLILRHPSGREEVLYQTNPQQQQFFWGKSTVLRYRVHDADVSGALLLPASYDPAKKYPMIVEIYEKRSYEARDYIDPDESTAKSSYTINPTAYTAEGYFVLFPDITYKVNDPGISALACVKAAVEAAVNQYSIDQTRIGLVGHSFGGYETAFIISQTDMFRTAVAGAGITDLEDFYLGFSIYGPNLTRVEEDQFRMTVPFYHEAFARNSPMRSIEKIHTPLLLWTGKEDGNIDWTQSRKLQTALWRLGKNSTMLVYPGEDHSLMKPENQKDLTLRMKEWFGYYLKDEPPAEWIKKYMGVTGQ